MVFLLSRFYLFSTFLRTYTKYFLLTLCSVTNAKFLVQALSLGIGIIIITLFVNKEK